MVTRPLLKPVDLPAVKPLLRYPDIEATPRRVEDEVVADEDTEIVSEGNDEFVSDTPGTSFALKLQTRVDHQTKFYKLLAEVGRKIEDLDPEDPLRAADALDKLPTCAREFAADLRDPGKEERLAALRANRAYKSPLPPPPAAHS